MIDLAELGALVRRARKEKGLRQAEVCAGAGCSRSTLGDLENGRTPEIGLMMVQRIMRVVGLELKPGAAAPTAAPGSPPPTG